MSTIIHAIKRCSLLKLNQGFIKTLKKNIGWALKNQSWKGYRYTTSMRSLLEVVPWQFFLQALMRREKHIFSAVINLTSFIINKESWVTLREQH